ncbi:MAG: tetratricopeptide repeat protein [Opitutaceae bacterium]|nr:tetratricopeptide repeat protein [Opitutaceae bacterium]
MTEPLSGWDLIARHLGGDAVAAFERMPPGDERNLGLAAALLSKYPQTKGNVARAAQLLETIIEGKGPPMFRSLALYLRARIEHAFREGRRQDAIHYYQQLRNDYPDSLLADNAAVKLALIEIERIGLAGSDAEVRSMIARLMPPRGSHAQGQYYYVVGSFFIERGDAQPALENLLKVRDLDTLVGRNRADVLVQIGRLSAQLGQVELARTAYLEFLESNPLDPRHLMVSDLLAQMEESL